jgi:glycosyltransferase involved in cell wall biosynthesis
MRIVHVVWSLNLGGQERFILNLSRALIAKRHEVSVVVMTEGGTLRSQFGGIELIDVVQRGGFDAGLFVRMARVIRARRPDVVHTNNPGPLMYGAFAARGAFVRRVVHTKHGANNVYTKRSLAFARAAVRTLSAFVAVSEPTAEVARTLERVPSRLLQVIPNGVPLDQFGADPTARARVRGELGIPTNAVVVGSVGRLVVEKDYPFLVRSIAPLLSHDLRLVLVGDGDQRAAIEAAIPPAARPFVHLTGMRADVPALFASFDVFALSSKTEGLPLVLPEAMASYLPIVATSVGGVPSVVPSHVGRLVPHGDERAMRGALEELTGSRETRRTLGEAAHAFAHARFSLDEMTAAYERLYSGA